MVREVLKDSFYQLLVIYTILIFLASLGIISKYTLHFEVFALVLAVFGVISLKRRDEIKVPSVLIALPLILLLVFRIIPYLNSDVPLGYDPGMYKYVIESYLASLPNIPAEELDVWIRGWSPKGMFVLTDILHIFGLSTGHIMIWIFIGFEAILGLAIYLVTVRFFNRNTAILALVIYSLSVIQFKVFWYMYYKNVLAMIVMLLCLYSLKSERYIPFIFAGAFLGGLHRPTFLIFGLTFLAYTLLNRKDMVKNIAAGASILLFAMTFYIDNFKEAILVNIDPLVTANIGAGTFIDIKTYEFSSLPYLPFALMGFLFLVKEKDYKNPLLLWFVINGLIVYFQLVFFNRFIIPLDIVMIILASVGAYELLKANKIIGTAILTILLFSSVIVMSQNVAEAKPLIDENELEVIKSFNNVEPDAYVMSMSSYYSPWIMGYSGRKTIAPGLFDYNRWNFEEWKTFWATGEKEKAVEMLRVYERPLYIYLGKRDRINEAKFENKCFKKVFQEDEVRIYELICY